MESTLTEFDLSIRYQIYRFFVETCRAPSPQDLADLPGVTVEAVTGSYQRLHDHHMIFLEPGTQAIRMANPFSAVPTRYKVRSGQKEWWANCAWDTLGIAAVLESDIEIEASYPDSGENVILQVKDGAANGNGHVVYFPLPCRQWYDDLAYT